jgi:hypothetical protein
MCDPLGDITPGGQFLNSYQLGQIIEYQYHSEVVAIAIPEQGDVHQEDQHAAPTSN